MSNRIDDEIDFHIDMLTRDLIAEGMSPDEARAEALRRFGDRGAVRASLHHARRGVRLTLITLATFTMANVMQRILWYAPAYRHLYDHHPFYVPELLKNACEVSVCVVALLLMGQRALARALAVERGFVRAMAVMLVATSPMLIGFALTRQIGVKDWLAVIYLAFLSPLVEEIVTRGFGFLSLRRAGWPLWPAAAVCALVTGLVHIEKGSTAMSILGLFAFTGLGSATFCWLVERWGSLWPAFALHALMNFWWEVFNVAPTALGGWFPALLQNASIIIAIVITLRMTPKRLAGSRQMKMSASRPATPMFRSIATALTPTK